MVFLLQIRYLNLQGFSPHSQLLVPQAQARLLLLQPWQRLVEYVRLILILPLLTPEQIGDQISNQEVWLILFHFQVPEPYHRGLVVLCKQLVCLDAQIGLKFLDQYGEVCVNFVEVESVFGVSAYEQLFLGVLFFTGIEFALQWPILEGWEVCAFMVRVRVWPLFLLADTPVGYFQLRFLFLQEGLAIHRGCLPLAKGRALVPSAGGNISAGRGEIFLLAGVPGGKLEDFHRILIEKDSFLKTKVNASLLNIHIALNFLHQPQLIAQ